MSRIDEALSSVDRADFLPPEHKDEAAYDAPVRIGYGQTNSQPYTVRLMLEWLDPQPGDHVLDVGSGSGWTTALLAYIVGPDGDVIAVEKVPELVRFGADNCLKAGVQNVRFYEAGKELGLPRGAPYDRILVSAEAMELPQTLAGQLKIGGRMVIPIRSSIHVISRTTVGYDDIEHQGFAFVPLI